MLALAIIIVLLFLSEVVQEESQNSIYPIVVSTWPFVEAVRAAWTAADSGLSAVDSVVEGCSACEELRCDGTGPGGSPDEKGETTLDALIMNGATMEVGAVAAMRHVKDGIRAAKLMMLHTKHTLLVGQRASEFALSMGLPGPTNLSSPESKAKWTAWKDSHCQPNFRKNVIPIDGCGPYHAVQTFRHTDSICPNHDIMEIDGCGPYHAVQTFRHTDSICPNHDIMGAIGESSSYTGLYNHDTIAMAVIDKIGNIGVGTSTNGASFKIPGWVGDGPIVGSSAYVDNEIGACGATGDGDIMMRFLSCYQVVESMRLGMEPKHAAKDAILRIAKRFPDFVGAVFAVNKFGIHAGACHGWTFQYSVRSPHMKDVEIFSVVP